MWAVWNAASVTQHIRDEVEDLREDLCKVQEAVASCQVQLTNHIPHQIGELRSQLAAIGKRLELHEEREEKHWELLTKVLTDNDNDDD